MARVTRLVGHGLIREGWPFIGSQIPAQYRSGPGMAKCECGEMSPSLGTTAARKRWHAEHKQAVRDGA